MSTKALFFLVPLFAACDFSLESDKPCRLTSDGWICKDAGHSDAAMVVDMGMMTLPDVGRDMTTPPPIDMNVIPSIDMASVEDVGQPDQPVEVPTATSCVEIRDRGLPTGLHMVVVGGVDTEVWCDIDVEGGGWMLVGRSAVDAQSNSFGWRYNTGTIANTASPYSLAVTDRPFTEVLVGNMAGAQELGDRVYRVGVPDDFWTACADASCTVTVSVARGGCTNVVMFNRMGYNNTFDRFWFRDGVADSTYGLNPNGFNTFYADCLGGEVHEEQGLVFVR